MTKIPVWSTAAGAFAFVWHERKRFAALAFAPVLFVSLLYVLTAWMLPIDAMAEIAEGKRSMVPLMLAIWGTALVSSSMLVTFSVAWHRRYLVPGEDVTVAQALKWRMRQTRFFLRLLGISVLVGIISIVFIMAVIFSVMVVASAESEAAMMDLGMVAATPVIVFIILVSSRLYVWLPATAVEDSMRLADVWRATRGNSWRLAFIFSLITIPLAFVSMGLQFLLEPAFFGFEIHALSESGDVRGMTEQMETARASMGLTVGFIANLIYMAIYYVNIAVGVTGLSIAYRHLTSSGGNRGEALNITA